MRKHNKPWRMLQDGIAEAIKSAGGIGVTVVDAVADAMSAALKDAGKVGSSALGAASEIAEAAIHGGKKIGGELGLVAKGFVRGLLRATDETGNEALTTIGHAAGCFMKQAGAAGGDLCSAAKGLVAEAADLASEIGVDATEAASVAAQSALDAAYDISAAAGEKVRNGLKGTIEGVKVVLKEPFKPHKR